MNTEVYTNQHVSVLNELEMKGMYHGKDKYIRMDLEEHADIVFKAYDFLKKKMGISEKEVYPVWVTLNEEDTMFAREGRVILKLSVPSENILRINIRKWGSILNYSYLPSDEKDLIRHRNLLKEMNVSDAKAYMTSFYPEIKNEIEKSWERLFDRETDEPTDTWYGIIPEIRKEWVVSIKR